MLSSSLSVTKFEKYNFGHFLVQLKSDSDVQQTPQISPKPQISKGQNRSLKFMWPLLAQLKIGFFSSFSAAAVYSTNETNKAGLKQSIIFRCLCPKPCIHLLKTEVLIFIVPSRRHRKNRHKLKMLQQKEKKKVFSSSHFRILFIGWTWRHAQVRPSS